MEKIEQQLEELDQNQFTAWLRLIFQMIQELDWKIEQLLPRPKK